MKARHRVVLCLGSNIEPRLDYLDRAQERAFVTKPLRELGISIGGTAGQDQA